MPWALRAKRLLYTAHLTVFAMKRDESGKAAGRYAELRAAPRNAWLFLLATVFPSCAPRCAAEFMK